MASYLSWLCQKWGGNVETGGGNAILGNMYARDITFGMLFGSNILLGLCSCVLKSHRVRAKGRSVQRPWRGAAEGHAELSRKTISSESQTTTAKASIKADFAGVLNALSDVSSRVHQLSSEALGDTCTWILEDQRLTDWRDSASNQILAVKGLPGTGKSVLARFLFEHLEQTNAETICIYHTCKVYESSVEVHCGRNYSNLRHFVGTILRRLSESRPETHSAISDKYDALSAEEKMDWKPIWDILLFLLRNRKMLTQDVLIVVDEFDRLAEEEQVMLAKSIIKGNKTDLSEQEVHPCLKMIITTRPTSYCLNFLSATIELTTERVRKDLHFFIDHRLSKLTIDEQSDDYRELRETIQQNAQACFSWVSHVTSQMRECASTAEMKTAFESIPPEIKHVYEDQFSSMSSSFKRCAELIFTWLITAYQPLQLTTLAEILAINPETASVPLERLLNKFTLLLYSAANGSVQLVHDSLRRYLERGHCQALKLPSETQRHRQLFEHCILVLGDHIPPEAETASSKTPLFEYACSFWYKHAQACQDDLDNYEWPDFFLRCSSPKNKRLLTVLVKGLYETDISLYTALRGLGKNTSILDVACAGGCADLLDAHLQKCQRCKTPKTSPSTADTALWHAAQFGQKKAAEVVLQQSKAVDVNVLHSGRTPLYEAVLKHHEEIAQLLLEFGADPNKLTSHVGSPLLAAAKHGSAKLCKLLLEKAADPNIMQPTYEKIPLHLAAERGHLEVVKLLAEVTTEINSLDRYGQTALHYAAENGYYDVVEFLVEGKGADFSIRDHRGRTPHTCAIERGHEDVAELLEI